VRNRSVISFASLTAVLSLAVVACGGPAATATPVQLRLQVSLTAEEIADFRPALERVDAAHQEFTVVLEEVPQGSEVEKVTTLLAGDDLPDVLRVQGLNVQQWIRRTAFAELGTRAQNAGLDLTDFYGGPLDQFRYGDKLWGLPDTASPEVVYYNRQMFTEGGIAMPTDSWTYDDMRAAAVALTTDTNGHHSGDAEFDPDAIEQWGWNGGITYFWQNALIKARGGELCANADCTLMSFTGPANQSAFEWWVSLVRDDHAALYDPYGGSQTGVEGDPFLTGKAAMGSNGSFAIGQLNAAGSIDYDIVMPLLGVDGTRYTPLSTNGYVISARSAHPDEAWTLVQELASTEFLKSTWAVTGNAVPARRSAASAVIDAGHAPQNQQALLAAMEFGQVFKPSTSHAFDAYGATVDLFRQMNTGELAVPDGLRQLEAAANEALAPDRSP
jgi:multiple sugar transport system substrate-binding protein